MTAQITGFRSRTDLRLRYPESRSNQITPQRGGVSVHWGGPTQPIGTNHASCEIVWRSWQNYHMNTHGWVDIAYTIGFCNHGYVLAGRGYFTRTAANGTNNGNQNYYAFVWIGGQGNLITTEAIDALEWLIEDSRSNGNAGTEVRPHHYFTGSTCAGKTLNDLTKEYHNTPITQPKPPPPPEPLDPWEEFMEQFTDEEKTALKALAKQLVKEKVSGESFVYQYIRFNRGYQKVVEDIASAIDEMDTSPRGWVRGTVAQFREAGARGWLRDYEKFAENRIYTEDDLN